MKTKLAVIFILSVMVVLMLVAAAPVLACGNGCPPPPPPPPPPCPADCSPGFWKNHTGIWGGDGGIEPGDTYLNGMTYLQALQGGKATRVTRFAVAAILNGLYPDAPCD